MLFLSKCLLAKGDREEEEEEGAKYRQRKGEAYLV